MFTGKAGDQEKLTLTRTLKSYDDYALIWEITGRGAIAIDSIKVTEKATGNIIVETDFEEPPIKQGLLSFQITDTKTYHLGDKGFEYSIRGANVQDLNGDGIFGNAGDWNWKQSSYAVVGGYWTKAYGSQKGLRYGSTVFLNDGTGVFNVIEGTDMFPTQNYYGSVEQFGIFLPTKVMPDKIEGMFVNAKSDYHTGSMTVRKGVFEGALGRGSELTVIPKSTE